MALWFIKIVQLFFHLPFAFFLTSLRRVLYVLIGERSCPVGLVVKKGWKTLSITFWGIPLPLLATFICTFSPTLFVLTETLGGKSTCIDHLPLRRLKRKNEWRKRVFLLRAHHPMPLIQYYNTGQCTKFKLVFAFQF